MFVEFLMNLEENFGIVPLNYVNLGPISWHRYCSFYILNNRILLKSHFFKRYFKKLHMFKFF